MLQTDGGSEFRSLSKKLSWLGIQHRVDCPHTSEQNGVIERKHCRLVDIGLTLLAQASLPLKLWYYAFAYVIHLMNRLHTPVLQKQSPYKVLYKVRLNNSSLKVFGCTCYPYFWPFQQHKLQFWSKQCVFTRVASNQKGYQCLDTDGRIFVSRLVTFDESRFLFKNSFFLSSGSNSIRSSHHKSCLPWLVAITPSAQNYSGFEQDISSLVVESIPSFSGLHSSNSGIGLAGTHVNPFISLLFLLVLFLMWILIQCKPDRKMASISLSCSPQF